MDKVLDKVSKETMEAMVAVNQEGVLECQVTDISHTNNTISYGVTSRKYVYAPKRITISLDGGSKYTPFNRVCGGAIRKGEIIGVGDDVDIPFCESRVEEINGENKIVVTLLDDTEIALDFKEFQHWMA